MLDVLQSQRIKDGLVKELNLPQSIIIASFDSPVYATNFSLRISKNVAYKLEGKKNQSEMPMNPVINRWSYLICKVVSRFTVIIGHFEMSEYASNKMSEPVGLGSCRPAWYVAVWAKLYKNLPRIGKNTKNVIFYLIWLSLLQQLAIEGIFSCWNCRR